MYIADDDFGIQKITKLHPKLLLNQHFHYLCINIFILQKQLLFKNKRPTCLQRSPEYQRLYNDFLSEELLFAYQQAHHRINKDQQWLRKAAINEYSLKTITIAINVLYIDKVEDDAYSV